MKFWKIFNKFKLAILFPFFLLIACSGRSIYEPEPIPIRITEIEVSDEYDSVGKLEVEVHIFDANSGDLLGCSGNFQGLGHVDSSDHLFYTNAEFVRPDYQTRTYLYYEDIQFRDIIIWVIEDDDNPCPGEIDHGQDDIIGISDPMDGRRLNRFRILSFDNVVHLRIGS